MKNIKLNYSEYDRDVGTSSIVLSYDGKLFSGHAYTHEEDRDKASELFGCKLAEMRATVKVYKHEREKMKQDADACMNLYKSLVCYKDFNKDSFEARKMRKQIALKVKAVNDITEKINALLWDIKMADSQRELFFRKLEKIRKVKND
jgi:hypothetical protein